MNDGSKRLERLIESWSEESSSHLARTEKVSDRTEDASVRALADVARITEFSRSLQRAGALDEAPTPERWGDLLILERIRSGASADVFRAWEPRLQREVALKLLRTDARDSASWIDEARALARVSHRNVVTVYGAAEHDGRGGVWMEYLKGESLAEAIDRAGPMALEDVTRVARELGAALQAVHDAGVVHGDVKPANIVLEPGGRAVLTDFGLGTWANRPRESITISGTPLFLSPERLDGRPATTQSDVYALGVTLWFALTRRYPYEGESLDELRAVVRSGPRASLIMHRRDVPERLRTAIERAIAQDEDTRPSAAKFLEMLPSSMSTASVSTARRPVLVLGVSIAVVSVAVLAFLMLAPRFLSTLDTGRGGLVTPPVAPAASYNVQATFLRKVAGSYQRLSTGDRVAPGDALSLEFRSSAPTWVYVLNRDERGETYLLFPQQLFDRANPIAPGTAVVLPGTVRGDESSWKVTSRGGREHFLVVANTAPVTDLENELSRLPAPSLGASVRYAPVAKEHIERLRGVGGVETRRSHAPTDTSSAFEHFRALAGMETGVRGVWVRTVVLENPLR